MKHFNKFFFATLLGTLLFNFFYRNTAEASARESYEKYLQGKAVFIDVREKAELLESGMVKGAIFFPLSEVEKDPKAAAKKISKLAKGREIYLYCRSGNRSGIVKEYLSKEGVEANNAGGFSALAAEKIPTAPGPK